MSKLRELTPKNLQRQLVRNPRPSSMSQKLMSFGTRRTPWLVLEYPLLLQDIVFKPKPLIFASKVQGLARQKSMSRCAVIHFFNVERPTLNSDATCLRASPLFSAIRYPILTRNHFWFASHVKSSGPRYFKSTKPFSSEASTSSKPSRSEFKAASVTP